MPDERDAPDRSPAPPRHSSLACLRMGSLCLDSPLILAPMAGFTDAPMRLMCRRNGASLVFTEMVDANGIVRASAKTLRLLDTFDEEAPVAAHLFGSDPGMLAESAAWVESTGRFAAVDLNAGCPARKVLRKGAGAALMRNPEKLERIVAAMRAATRLPLMVKTRIGVHRDRIPIRDLAARIENAGADALSLHARLASRGHSGPVDLERLADIRARCRIPVIGNGGVATGDDAIRMREASGVAGIMVGRAAMGAPWVFAEISAALTGRSVTPPSLEARREVIEQHLELQVRLARRQCEKNPQKFCPEEIAAIRFRGSLNRYLHGLHGACSIRSRLNSIRDLKSVRQAIDACFRNAPPGSST